MNDQLRDAARKRIKSRREFWNMVIIFVIVTLIVNAVWFFSGRHSYYWPVWPMIGFAIAILFTALGTFGPGSKPITDEAIDEEIRRMGGGGRE